VNFIRNHLAILTATFAVAGMGLAGCDFQVAEYPMLCTGSIDCNNLDVTGLERHPGAVGDDTRLWGIGSSVSRATDRALKDYQGNVLLDAVVYYEVFPLIWGGYIVEGTAVMVPVDAGRGSGADERRKMGDPGLEPRTR
jgi:hypothetical protein